MMAPSEGRLILMSKVEDRVRAAGFESVKEVQRALDRLWYRRDELIDRRTSPGALGGFESGSGIPAEQWYAMNRAIDHAGGLGELEAQISRLESLLP